MEENKTIEEVFNEYAVDHNYSSWKLLTEDDELFTWEIEEHRYKAVERYAKHREKLAIEKSLELASEEAEIKRVTAYSDFPKVDVKLFKTKTDSIAGVVETLSINKAGILSLKDRVIDELRK